MSREQVYRLVAHTPERLSLATLAALCDIFEVSPAELIEPVREAPGGGAKQAGKAGGPTASVSELRPRRARVALDKP